VSDREDLGLRLDTLQANLATVVVGPVDRIRVRGGRRRRQATVGALAATLGAVVVLGMGTVRALEPQSQPPSHPVTMVPVPPTPVDRAEGQADTRVDAAPVLDPDARLVLPDALLGPEVLPVHPGVRWASGPVRSGEGLWTSVSAGDHEHCWGRLLPGPRQQAARHFTLLDDPAGTDADEVLVLARNPEQARVALETARRRCAAGASSPIRNPPPGSPPVTQFKSLNGVDGFVHTRDATTLDGVADRPNCEYTVLVQRGALLVLVVVRQRVFSYDLPRSDVIAVTLQALDRALSSTTTAPAAG
jgi:hypothetical protein